MQQFFYLVSPGHQGVEVRRVASVGQLQPLLDCLSKGEEPDFPRIHEFPEKVRLAKETLEQGKEGWLLIPAQESEGPSLGEADREFLESLRQAPAEEEPPGAIFTEIVSNVRSLLPPDVNLDHEIERFVVLYLIDLMAKPAILQASEASQGAPAAEVPAEVPPVKEPTAGRELEPPVIPGASLHFQFEIGYGLLEKFGEAWTELEQSVQACTVGAYDGITTLGWKRVLNVQSPERTPQPAANEVWISVDGVLRGGLSFDLKAVDVLRFKTAIIGAVYSHLPDHFSPEQAARILYYFEERYPHTTEVLRELGWTLAKLHQFFRLVLRRGLPLKSVYLKDLFLGLVDLDPTASCEQLENLIENCQFAWNCRHGYSGSSLRALKLSREAERQIGSARDNQDLLGLTALQNKRWKRPEVLIVPDELCLQARMLFGRRCIASEFAIPENLDLTIVGEV